MRFRQSHTYYTTSDGLGKYAKLLGSVGGCVERIPYPAEVFVDALNVAFYCTL